MTRAGTSAANRARQLRQARPWWRRLLNYLGWWPDHNPEAANYEAGAAGERLTAELLRPLTREGWHVLHDRAIPGSRANVDHVLVPPHGRYLIVLDSKLWSRHRGTLDVTRAGRLVHGGADRHNAITTVQWEADRAADLLIVPAVPMIVMHSAPVARGMVRAGTVPVVAAKGLLALLRAHAAEHRPDRAGAARLAARTTRKLPAYS